ncbi:hypothetical protein OG216_46070 (plasmid) [Streptomycetaceae bacterium NBC_01309]
MFFHSSGNRRRFVALTGAVGVALSGMVLLGAGPAAADPYNCQTQRFEDETGRGVCWNGTGTYRAVGTCEAAGKFPVAMQGHTVGIGEYSGVTCIGLRGDWELKNLSIQVMSW